MSARRFKAHWFPRQGRNPLIDCVLSSPPDCSDRKLSPAKRAARRAADLQEARRRAALSPVDDLVWSDSPEVQAAPVPAPRVRHTAAERIAKCGRADTIVKCPTCGEKFKTKARCHNRLCPDCAKLRSLVWYHRLKDAVLTFRQPKVLTLTTVRTLTPQAALDVIQAAWPRFRRHFRLPRGIYAVEAKPQPDGGYHVHMHILMDSPYIPQAELSDYWQKLTGADVVWIESVDVRGGERGRERLLKALRECVKYMTTGIAKGVTLTADQVDELDAAIYRRRLVATWGKVDVLSVQTSAITNLTSICCPFCGSRLARVGFLPEGGSPDIPSYSEAVHNRGSPPWPPELEAN